MPVSNHLKAVFYPDGFYHIVCKSIDGLLLFNDESDYEILLHRFKKFIADFMDTWSYCLLSNHTHHVCNLKSALFIETFIQKLPPAELTKSMAAWLNDKTSEALFDEMIERQMNSFLVSYANYFNNKYSRKGGLFQKPFKRLQISGDAYLQQAIVYTNANAQKHKIVADFKQYHHSSFNNVLKNDTYFIDSKEVLDFFGGKEKFIQTHEMQVAYFYGKGWPSSKLE